MAPGDAGRMDVEGVGEDICRDCNGSGKRGSDACPTCNGTGRIAEGIGGG